MKGRRNGAFEGRGGGARRKGGVRGRGGGAKGREKMKEEIMRKCRYIMITKVNRGMGGAVEKREGDGGEGKKGRGKYIEINILEERIREGIRREK